MFTILPTPVSILKSFLKVNEVSKQGTSWFSNWRLLKYVLADELVCFVIVIVIISKFNLHLRNLIFISIYFLWNSKKSESFFFFWEKPKISYFDPPLFSLIFNQRGGSEWLIPADWIFSNSLIIIRKNA